MAVLSVERSAAEAQPGGGSRRTATLVALIVGGALGVRLAVVFATPEYRPVFDGLDYDTIARSLARGSGYMLGPNNTTAFRPPGYAFFLAGIYALTGMPGTKDAVEVVRVVQAILGTVTVGLLGAVAAMLWNRRIALVTLGLGAVYVPFLEIGEAYVSEALFLPLMLGALLCALGERRGQHRWRWSMASGLLMGLAILTRPNGIVLLLPLFVALWHGGRRRSWRALKAPVIMLLAAVVAVAPWTVRNEVSLHSFIPVSTDLGETLAGTYNEVARHDTHDSAGWRIPRNIPPYESIFHPVGRSGGAASPGLLRPGPVDEHRRDFALTSAVLGYVEAHPRYLGSVAWWNTRRLLDLAGMGHSRFTAATIGVDPHTATEGVICFWLVALLAVVGASRPQARRTPRWFWACPALLYASIVLVTVETPRFRAALDPFIVLLAAMGAQSLPKFGRVLLRPPDNPSPQPVR